MGWSFRLVLVGGQRLQPRHGRLIHARGGRAGRVLQLPRRAHRRHRARRHSVFYKDDAGDVFHTYSAYKRGIDMFNTAYNYLDTVPKGRDEGA